MKELAENEGKDFATMQAPGANAKRLKTSAAGVNVTRFYWYYSWLPLSYHNMLFVSGFAGAAMTEDGYVTPKLAWAVASL